MQFIGRQRLSLRQEKQRAVLDRAVYDISGLANANHNMNKLFIAIEIAKRI